MRISREKAIQIINLLVSAGDILNENEIGEDCSELAAELEELIK